MADMEQALTALAAANLSETRTAQGFRREDSDSRHAIRNRAPPRRR